MNSKGHLIISYIKSAIRIISCIASLVASSVTPIAVGLIVAEAFGFLEEMVDKR